MTSIKICYYWYIW